MRWYRLAAEQGDASAQFNLGVMYDNGEGVLKDDAEAVRLYRLAAEQGAGDASAQWRLGNMYNYGRGVPEDDAEAVRWYRLAAEQGVTSAQFDLGLMYANGRGVLKNSVLAHMWSNIAGANGNASARKLRDSLERDMTPAEISRATELARVCMTMTSDYQDCEPRCLRGKRGGSGRGARGRVASPLAHDKGYYHACLGRTRRKEPFDHTSRLEPQPWGAVTRRAVAQRVSRAGGLTRPSATAQGVWVGFCCRSACPVPRGMV